MEFLEAMLKFALEAVCWYEGDSVTFRGLLRALMGIAAIFCFFAAVASGIKSGGWMWTAFVGVGVLCACGGLALRE